MTNTGAVDAEINLAEVFQALKLCTSSRDPLSVQSGERTIQQYQNHKQFLQVLGVFLADENVDEETRNLAAILFRNSTERFWRNGPLMLGDNEKRATRNMIFRLCFLPQSPATVKQLIAAIGKISRFDFPRHWPSVIDEIGEKLAEANEEIQYRAIRLLHECTKELATKRLPLDRKAFYEVSGRIFVPLLNILRASIESTLNGATIPILLDLFCKKALYSAKVLQTLQLSAFPVLISFQPFHDYWNFVADNNLIIALYTRAVQLANTEDIRQAGAIGEQVVITVKKIGLRFLRTMFSLMEERPLNLASPLRRIFGQVVPLVFADNALLMLREKDLVTAMNIIKIFHSERSYRSSTMQDSAEMKDYSEIAETFFNAANVPGMVELLVLRYLPLTENDLDKLEHDAEDYSNEFEAHENWKFCLRPATESLLSALSYCNPKIAPDKICELMKQTTVNAQLAIADKEAIYFATGLAAFHLFESMDFDALFRDYLWQEFQNKTSQNMIIRRRILWLLGEWCAVRLSNESRAVLFKMLVEGLACTEHLAVRLMAARVLKSCVDIFEFRVDDIMPAAPAIMHGLFHLILQCSSHDSQLVILNSLNIALERLEMRIQPFVPQLLQCLSSLWKDADENYLIQCGIVSAIKTTVKCLRRDAHQMDKFACELIALGTDLNNPISLHLLTDALELWSALLQNCEFAGECLKKLLLDRLPLMLEIASENLEIVREIIESYLLICPDLVFAEFLDKLVAWSAVQLPKFKEEGLSMIVKLLDLSVQVFTSAAVPKMLPALIVMARELPTDANRSYALKMGLISACLYYNLAACSEMFAEMAREKQLADSMDVFHNFVRMWTEQINWISKLERLKLCGLAMMNVLVIDPKLMSGHFPALSLALTEISSRLSGDSYIGSDNSSFSSSAGEIDLLSIGEEDAALANRMSNSIMLSATYEEVRRQDLRRRNVCYAVDFLKFMKEKWLELTRKTGQDFIHHLYNMLDAETKDKFIHLVAAAT